MWLPYEILMNERAINSNLNNVLKSVFQNKYSKKDNIIKNLGFNCSNKYYNYMQSNAYSINKHTQKNNTIFTYIPRKHFSESNGKDIFIYLNKIKECSNILSVTNYNNISKKNLCISSLSALMFYIEENGLEINYNTLKVNFYYSENYMNVCYNTVIGLELLLNNKNNSTELSIISLFSTKTMGGYRLLRGNLLQPLCNENELNIRYDAVEECISKPTLTYKLRSILTNFKLLELYISKLNKPLTMHINNTSDTNKENIIENLSDKQIISYLYSINYIRKCLKIITSEDFNNIFDNNSAIFCNVNNTSKNSNQDMNNVNYFINSLFMKLRNLFSNPVYITILNKINEIIDNFNTIDENMQDTNTNNNIISKNHKELKIDFIYFMIKKGISNVLDILINIYSDTIEEVYNQFEKIKLECNIPNLKLQCNLNNLSNKNSNSLTSNNIGFYFIINKNNNKKNNKKSYNDIDNIEDMFDISIEKKGGKSYYCSTNSLLSLSERTLEVKKEINKHAFKIIIDLVMYIQNNINYLYNLNSSISLLDLILCISDYCISNNNNNNCDLNNKKSNNFIRPIILSKDISINPNNKVNKIDSIINYKSNFKLFIKNSKHPLLEKQLLDKSNVQSSVSNDYFINDLMNIIVLKGPNSSGKTTYLKQLSTIIILAQIGCFIDCEYFSYSPINYLFSKYNIEFSTLKKQNKIIQNIADINNCIDIINSKRLTNKEFKSLIILDELFDNENKEINNLMAINLYESLSNCKYDNNNKVNTIAYLSTHNEDIYYISSLYCNVQLCYMKADINANSCKFYYKYSVLNNTYFYKNNLNKDNNEFNNIYGINLASYIGLDNNLINNSVELVKDLYYKKNNFNSLSINSMYNINNQHNLNIDYIINYLKDCCYQLNNKINIYYYCHDKLHEQSLNDMLYDLIKYINNIAL